MKEMTTDFGSLGSVRGRPDMVAHAARVMADFANQQRETREILLDRFHCAAFRYGFDGLFDREKHTVSFFKNDLFGEPIKSGDLFAVGGAGKWFRIYRVTTEAPGFYCDKWHYEDTLRVVTPWPEMLGETAKAPYYPHFKGPALKPEIVEQPE